MNYLEPDNIWEIFGIKSETDFREKYLLLGKFHSLVPKKIIDDYKLVERLLYYSYFHYPLIDEAFSKSTRIFEASVTLKLEIEGLKKDGFETLHSKLNRLKKYCSNDLFEQWKNAKELRNDFAHREAGIFMGIALINGFKHNLNLINSIFLEPCTILEKENNHNELLKQSEHLINGFFVLEHDDKRILVAHARPFTTGIIKNLGQSLWVFIPITGEKSIEKNSDLPKAFILKLENLQINKSGLSATDSTTKKSINLTTTDNFENLKKFTVHDSRIRALEIESQDISREYMAILKHETNKGIANFLYEDW
jgi:hypothetical protein